MPQRIKVVGARAPILWLLIVVALVLVAALAVGGLIIYPRLQVEQHYQAGVAFEDVGDWDKAASKYEQVISADAGYKDAQVRLAQVKTRLVESKATATAVAAIATMDALEAHYQQGLAYINQTKWPEAQAELQAVFEIDPNYKDIQAQLGVVNSEVMKLIPTPTPTPPATPTPRGTPTPTLTPTSTPRPTRTPTPPPLRFSYDAYVDDNWDVHIWHLQNKRSTRITQDAEWDGEAAWSPDGQQLAFVSDRSGSGQLYLYDLAVRQVVEQLTWSLGYKALPAWSPDGKQILYQEWTEENNWQLWLLTLETGEIRQLTHTGTNKTPQWSPEGDQIVFSAARSDSNSDGTIDDDDERHIYLMDSDGKNVRALAADPAYYDWSPHWMPDGVHVVFSRHVKGETVDDNGPGEIYMVNVNAGDLRVLTFTSSDETGAVPSPNGDLFLIERWEDDTDKIYLASWDRERLGRAEFIVEGYSPAWAPTR